LKSGHPKYTQDNKDDCNYPDYQLSAEYTGARVSDVLPNDFLGLARSLDLEPPAVELFVLD